METEGGSQESVKTASQLSSQPQKSSFYESFKNLLAEQRSKSLREKMMNFLNLANSHPTPDESLVKTTLRFIQTFSEECTKLWGPAALSPEDCLEAVEGIVCKSLYDQLFKACKRDNQDKTILKRVLDARDAGGLDESDLDLKEGLIEAAVFEDARKQLRKMTGYKTPRDKLVCILNACKLITGMIWDYHSRNNNGAGVDSPSGADELLPLMILLVFESDIEEMASQAYFIKKFRNENLLSGAGEYYLTTFESTLDFIIKLQPKAKKVDQELAEGMAEIDFLVTSDSTKTPDVFVKPRTHGTGPGAASIAPSSPTFDLLGINGFPRDQVLTHKSLQALRDSTRQLLYENNEKYISLKEKSLPALFVGDLEKFHYEYHFMLDKYKQLSATVSGFLKASASAGQGASPVFGSTLQ